MTSASSGSLRSTSSNGVSPTPGTGRADRRITVGAAIGSSRPNGSGPTTEPAGERVDNGREFPARSTAAGSHAVAPPEAQPGQALGDDPIVDRHLGGLEIVGHGLIGVLGHGLPALGLQGAARWRGGAAPAVPPVHRIVEPVRGRGLLCIAFRVDPLPHVVLLGHEQQGVPALVRLGHHGESIEAREHVAGVGLPFEQAAPLAPVEDVDALADGEVLGEQRHVRATRQVGLERDLELGLPQGSVGEGLRHIGPNQRQRPGGQGGQGAVVVIGCQLGRGGQPRPGQMRVDDREKCLLVRQGEKAARLFVVVSVAVGLGQERRGGPCLQADLAFVDPAISRRDAHPVRRRRGGEVHLEIDGQAEMPQQLGVMAEQADQGVEVELRPGRVLLALVVHRRPVRGGLGQRSGVGGLAVQRQPGGCGQRQQVAAGGRPVRMGSGHAEVEVEHGLGEVPRRHRLDRRLAEVEEAVGDDRRVPTEHRRPVLGGRGHTDHAMRGGDTRTVDLDPEGQNVCEGGRPVEPLRVVVEHSCILETGREVDGEPAGVPVPPGGQGARQQMA